ncbi:hypothetical protein [Micromonospora wenchangensis]|uniref:hypothetical protein n=1 Tax=Micromonospora wenchangensis TaxID=1185415 RepID=UPI00382AD83D
MAGAQPPPGPAPGDPLAELARLAARLLTGEGGLRLRIDVTITALPSPPPDSADAPTASGAGTPGGKPSRAGTPVDEPDRRVPIDGERAARLRYTRLPPAADHAQAYRLLAAENGWPPEAEPPSLLPDAVEEAVEGELSRINDAGLTRAVRGMLAIAADADSLGWIRSVPDRADWLRPYRPAEHHRAYRDKLVEVLALVPSGEPGDLTLVQRAINVDRHLRSLVPASVDPPRVRPPAVTSWWWQLLEGSLDWIRRQAGPAARVGIPRPGTELAAEDRDLLHLAYPQEPTGTSRSTVVIWPAGAWYMGLTQINSPVVYQPERP